MINTNPFTEDAKHDGQGSIKEGNQSESVIDMAWAEVSGFIQLDLHRGEILTEEFMSKVGDAFNRAKEIIKEISMSEVSQLNEHYKMKHEAIFSWSSAEALAERDELFKQFGLSYYATYIDLSDIRWLFNDVTAIDTYSHLRPSKVEMHQLLKVTDQATLLKDTSPEDASHMSYWVLPVTSDLPVAYFRALSLVDKDTLSPFHNSKLDKWNKVNLHLRKGLISKQEWLKAVNRCFHGD